MNKRTVAGALFVFAGALHAGSAAAVDLLTVVEQSSDHDADLAAFRAGSRAAGEAVPKARAALLPQLAGGWGRAYNSTATEGLPHTNYWQNGWTVTLTQPVFDWGRWTTYRQADFVRARGAVDLARAQQSAMLRAVQAYFDELAAEDELARANDYTAALDMQLGELRRRRRAGEATIIDLQEAEAAREQAQSQQLDARGDLQLKRLALEHITGERFAGLSRLSEAAVVPALQPDDMESWASQAEAHDYAVQLKQIDRRVAELEVEKARAGRLPVVNVTASHTPAGAASGYVRPTTTNTAMLSVTIPIFDGGATNATIDETLALADKAQDELVAATRSAGTSARENWSRFHAGIERVESLSRLVQTSRAALDATKLGYQVGSRASTDVLRASEAFFANRRDLIRARYATVLALLQLKAATAGLNLDEIARVNELLLKAAGGGTMARDEAKLGTAGEVKAVRVTGGNELQRAVAAATRATAVLVQHLTMNVDPQRAATGGNAQWAVLSANAKRAMIDANVQRAVTDTNVRRAEAVADPQWTVPSVNAQRSVINVSAQPDAAGTDAQRAMSDIDRKTPALDINAPRAAASARVQQPAIDADVQRALAAIRRQ
jgi:outer membrane protein